MKNQDILNPLFYTFSDDGQTGNAYKVSPHRDIFMENSLKDSGRSARMSRPLDTLNVIAHQGFDLRASKPQDNLLLLNPA
jgi:hypothetical protein